MRRKRYTLTAVAKGKIRKSLLGNKRAKGLKHSETFKKHISRINKGNKHALGAKHTIEWKKQRSKQHKAWWKNKKEDKI
jgi:hypothetical protein